MPLPYEKLTQILGIEASDYPPEHETTPEFMNEKFNELLLNDKELLKQINVLEGSKVDKITLNRDTNIDIFHKEGTNRIYNATGLLPKNILQGNNDIMLTCYPLEGGTSFIRKTLLDVRSNKMYLYSKRADVVYAWEEIATTETYKIPLLNDWENSYADQVELQATRSGNIVSLTGCIRSATGTIYLTIGQLPEGFRPPKFVMPRILNSTGVSHSLIIRNDGTFAPNEAWTPNETYQINVSFPIE